MNCSVVMHVVTIPKPGIVKYPDM